MKVSLCGVGREEKRRKNIAGKTGMKERCTDEQICDNIEESGVKNLILHIEVGTFSKMHECESHAVHIVLIKGNDSGVVNMSSTFPNNNL